METDKFTKNEIKILKYIQKKIKNENYVPNYDELYRYLKINKINLGSYKNTIKSLQTVRNNIFEIAIFSTLVPVKYHQTITIPKIGLLAIDFCFYKQDLKWHNKNYIGFLMVVGVNTKKFWAVPMKSRKMHEFETALEEICLGNVFPSITNVISDRESAIFSQKFQAKMKKKYNIKFQFLHRMNKAYPAENAIRHVKEHLSILLDSKDSKRWIDLLPTVINSHNTKELNNTKYTPNKIDDTNFLDYLSKSKKIKYLKRKKKRVKRVKDITMLFNTNSYSFDNLPKGKWRKKTFKFDIGDKVLISFKSLYGSKLIQKPSVEGTYSKNL